LHELVETSSLLNNDIDKTITEMQQLRVIVEKYPIQESFNDMVKGFSAIWKDNQQIIILLIGIFLTPFGAWAFDRFIKKEKRIKRQKNNSVK
jgi:hypothetical protein